MAEYAWAMTDMARGVRAHRVPLTPTGDIDQDGKALCGRRRTGLWQQVPEEDTNGWRCRPCERAEAHAAEVKPVCLFWVHPADMDEGVFVFATSRNRARMLGMAELPLECDYIDMRAKCLARDVGGDADVVVVTEEDPGYARVTALGFGFESD